MKKYFFGLIILTLLVSSPSSTHACSCAMPTTANDALEKSAAVFSGKVLNIGKTFPEGPREKRVTLEVDTVWKGDIELKTTISTAGDSAGCGYEFNEGQSYIVYAYENEGKLWTTLCSRTATLSEATNDTQELGAGTPPLASVPGNSNGVRLVVALAGLGGVILIVLILKLNKKETK